MNVPQTVLLGVLGLAVVGSAIGVVTFKQYSRGLFVESQALLAEQDRLDMEWNMLQLEQAAWATHPRIEQAARSKLNMRFPGREDVIILKSQVR